ncbi:MAG: ATP-dependent RecD-like DNA helicase [Tenericutes bacterium]|nr:ATP-dependent RecD-like DNA helicase [Mycoplasmatota bacterium]
MDNIYIKGNFKRSIYRSDNGYIIGLFKIKETNSSNLEEYINHTITFTGYFHELIEEETYLFSGNIVEHEKYGTQFQVENYERILPEENDAIIEFLSGGLFKGIGEKTAEKIVNYLGKDTLNIIIENPNNLLLIPTITKRQIDTLHNTLLDYQSSYKTIVFLNEIGFSTRDSLLIYNKYKDKTEIVLNDNIYLLSEDIEEITFKKVDIIALKNQVKRNDIRRIAAGIIYVLNEVCNTIGHSYLLKDEIILYLTRALNIDLTLAEIDQSLENLARDLKIINTDEKYYLTKMYEAEDNIAKRCGYLMRAKEHQDKKLEVTIREIEKNFGYFYNEEQLEAIKLSYMKNILIVTGGPGTGKTTIINTICELYRQMNKLSYDKLAERIALLAPTGRASKRISESTNLPASTIHRFLKWNKESNKFGINEYHKSSVDFVIIDEFSMVDTYLFDSLLKGLRYDTKIILVGDYNQLPSVGSGQLLKDMIESESLHVVKLKQLYRQKENSNIINLAYQINENKLDQTIFNQTDDLTFIPIPQNKVVEEIVNIASNYTDNDQKLQILAPMYKGINGIDNINISLQNVFNPESKSKKEIIINNVVYRENDKVIQLSNMPDENIFNGDIGYIETIKNGSKKEIYINFDGNTVRYTPANFQKFKHAYAISIHKSQGSEFDTVIIPLVNNYGKMLYRKLIYTAVTRVKKKLYLIGEIEALEKAIQNNDSNIRRTTLKKFIIDNIKNV